MQDVKIIQAYSQEIASIIPATLPAERIALLSSDVLEQGPYTALTEKGHCA